MEWPWSYKIRRLCPLKAKDLIVYHAIQMKMCLIWEPNVFNPFFVALCYLVKLFTHLDTQGLVIVSQSLLYLKCLLGKKTWGPVAKFSRQKILTCQVLASAYEAISSDFSTLIPDRLDVWADCFLSEFQRCLLWQAPWLSKVWTIFTFSQFCSLLHWERHVESLDDETFKKETPTCPEHSLKM